MNEFIEKDRLKMITSFTQLITKMTDSKNEMPKFRDFLNDIILRKNLNPPIIEFLTVLRFKKPIVFKTLRDATLPGTNFYQIIRLEIDLEMAIERLGVGDKFA
jgi:hypothetical protein